MNVWPRHWHDFSQMGFGLMAQVILACWSPMMDARIAGLGPRRNAKESQKAACRCRFANFRATTPKFMSAPGEACVRSV